MNPYEPPKTHSESSGQPRKQRGRKKSAVLAMILAAAVIASTTTMLKLVQFKVDAAKQAETALRHRKALEATRTIKPKAQP